jgi:hypothetical protein
MKRLTDINIPVLYMVILPPVKSEWDAVYKNLPADSAATPPLTAIQVREKAASDDNLAFREFISELLDETPFSPEIESNNSSGVNAVPERGSKFHKFLPEVVIGVLPEPQEAWMDLKVEDQSKQLKKINQARKDFADLNLEHQVEIRRTLDDNYKQSSIEFTEWIAAGRVGQEPDRPQEVAATATTPVIPAGWRHTIPGAAKENFKHTRINVITITQQNEAIPVDVTLTKTQKQDKFDNDQLIRLCDEIKALEPVVKLRVDGRDAAGAINPGTSRVAANMLADIVKRKNAKARENAFMNIGIS